MVTHCARPGSNVPVACRPEQATQTHRTQGEGEGEGEGEGTPPQAVWAQQYEEMLACVAKEHGAAHVNPWCVRLGDKAACNATTMAAQHVDSCAAEPVPW